MTSSSSLKGQALALMFAKVMSVSFQILTPIIFVRVFSKYDYGLFQNINLLIIFVSAIISWNLTSSLYYYFNTVSDKGQLLLHTITIQLLLSITFILLYIPFGHLLLSSLDIQLTSKLVLLIGVIITLYFNVEFLETILVVEKKSKSIIIYTVVFSVVKTLITVSVAYFFKRIDVVLYALFLVYGLQSLFMFVYVHKRYELSIKKYNRRVMYDQIKYVFPLGWAKIIGEIGNKVDKLMFAHAFSKQENAIYSVAGFRLPFVNLIFPSIGNVIVPQIVLLAKQNDYKEVRVLWHKMIKYFAIVTFPFLVYSLLTAKELILTIYTDQYIDAINMYRLLLFTFLAQVFARGVIINALGQTHLFFKIQLFSTVIGVILCYLLIKYFGPMGAAISALTIFYITSFLQVYSSKILLRLSFRDWLPWIDLTKIGIISVISAIIFVPLKIYLTSNILILIVSAILYSIAVLLMFNYFKIFTIDSFREITRNVFKKA